MVHLTASAVKISQRSATRPPLIGDIAERQNSTRSPGNLRPSPPSPVSSCRQALLQTEAVHTSSLMLRVAVEGAVRAVDGAFRATAACRSAVKLGPSCRPGGTRADTSRRQISSSSSFHAYTTGSSRICSMGRCAQLVVHPVAGTEGTLDFRTHLRSSAGDPISPWHSIPLRAYGCFPCFDGRSCFM